MAEKCPGSEPFFVWFVYFVVKSFLFQIHVAQIWTVCSFVSLCGLAVPFYFRADWSPLAVHGRLRKVTQIHTNGETDLTQGNKDNEVDPRSLADS